MAERAAEGWAGTAKPGRGRLRPVVIRIPAIGSALRWLVATWVRGWVAYAGSIRPRRGEE